jgi:hypothetical protein
MKPFSIEQQIVLIRKHALSTIKCTLTSNEFISSIMAININFYNYYILTSKTLNN